MGSTRRSFTDEYKADAVSLVTDGGRSVAEVAKNIGCHEMTSGEMGAEDESRPGGRDLGAAA
jgi:transposase